MGGIFHGLLLVEEVRRLFDEIEIEGTTLRNRGEGDVRIVLDELVVEALEERSAVEFDESVTKFDVHAIDIAGVGPVGVVDRGEGDALAFAGKCSEKHVRRVERVNKVGREGRALTEGVDRASGFVFEIDGLEGGFENVLFGHLLVGLRDG